MNVLIVFESGYGQAERVAQTLAAAVRAEGHAVEVARASEVSTLHGFDAVIVGGSIRIGKHQPELIAFCQTHRAALARMPNAFFSVSVSARRLNGSGQREVAKTLARFIAETGWGPQRLWPIAGALRYTRYPVWIKAMLVFIALLTGGDTDTSRDHEYTDWDAVAALGREFAQSLPRVDDGSPLPKIGLRTVGRPHAQA